MLATAVPWPFVSLAGSPPNADQPEPTFRSELPPATPVSRTAIFAEPLGLTDPKTLSQPIFGRAHCEP